ncbi:hypothetical protein M569_09407 [Genlisea aurea]|uniref:TCP domain-containing protein n=1 Tax=Genlisea aurea TaxID=192259 RepID=S8CEX4_9LAMI|nr:hypothetical protein M569_09407 [Genlisea aurea]
MIPAREEEIKVKAPPSSSQKQKSSTTTTTITSWSRSRIKDPRIVRVSKALGSKDRHSKVCTVKGLRDRRVRLSIPTAVQIYDLQERLNLSQPSKVVDWLLDAAKKDINELPPLQQIPNFTTSSIEAMLGSGKLRNEAVLEKWPHVFCGNPVSDQVEMSGICNPYNPFLKWDSSNSCHHKGHPSQNLGSSLEDYWHGFGVVQLQPSLGYHPPCLAQQVFGFDDAAAAAMPILFMGEEKCGGGEERD